MYLEQGRGNLKYSDEVFNRNRGSADFGWCVFFLIFIAGMVATTVYGYKTGKVLKLVAPVDGDFRICGFDKGVEDYPNLYIAKMNTVDINKLFRSAICVKSCPAKASEKIECAPTKEVGSCDSKIVEDHRYNSIDLAHYCFPSNLTELPADMHKSYDAAKAQLLKTRIGEGINNIY